MTATTAMGRWRQSLCRPLQLALLGLSLGLCLSLAWLSQAQAAYGLTELPALVSPVTDLTNTLTAAEQTALNQKLTEFSRVHGSQIAVLLLPSTQPEGLEQFGIRLAETWNIGRDKQDDGVILLIAKNDRKMRIEVGYGLEGAIPDAIAKRIISEQLAPAFKRGQFYGGINQATDTLIQLIQGEHLPAPAANQVDAPAHWMSWLPMLMIAAMVAGAILKGLFGTVPGSLLTGAAMGAVAGWLGAALLVMGLVALASTVFVMAMAGRSGAGLPYAGYPGWSGGSGSGPDIFRGGGGDFGGGGASGDW